MAMEPAGGGGLCAICQRWERRSFVRRILILTILVLMAVIAGILFIRDDRQNVDLASKTTKVGLLLNGSRSDRSFSQTHYEALESLQDELNLEIVCRENVPADCYKDIESLIRDKGCEIIVGVSFGFGESMQKAAECESQAVLQ